MFVTMIGDKIVEYLKVLRNNIIHVCVITGFLILFIWMAFFCTNNVTISFDASMNDQVSNNIAKYGKYASSYIDVGYNATESTLFDHKIQTGSPVILPTALLDKIFGVSSSHMQIVLLCYWFLLVVLVYICVSKVSIILGIVVPLLMMPYMIDNVFFGYGEVAMFSIMFSFVLMFTKAHNEDNNRIWILAGIIAGLGYLMKTVFLICIPSVAAIFLFDLVTNKKNYKSIIQKYALMFLGGVAIISLFEIYKCVSLGGIHNYIDWWMQEVRCILTESSAQDAHETNIVGIVSHAFENIKWYAKNFGIPQVVVIISFLLPIIYIIICIKHSVKFEYSILILSIIFYTYMAWWLIVVTTQRLSERRILSAFFISIVYIVLLFGKFVRHIFIKYNNRWYLTITYIIFAFVGISIVYPRLSTEISKMNSFKNQKDAIDEAANYIKRIDDGSVSFYGIGGWQNPTIAGEAQVIMHNLDCEDVSDNAVFVEDIYMRSITSTIEDIKLKFYCEELFSNSECTMWKIYKNRDDKIAENGNYLMVNAFLPYWGSIKVTYNGEYVETTKYTCMYDHVAIPAPNIPINSILIEFENFEDNKTEVKNIVLYEESKEINLLDENQKSIDVNIIN